MTARLAWAWIGLLCLGCLALSPSDLRLGRQLGVAEDRIDEQAPAERELAPAGA